jgi:hypothetical protein
MAKALELSADTLTAPPVPAKQGREAAKPEAKREPLQVRWPPEDVKAAKLAAIQKDFPTVSDFMLACFHAYMKSSKQA